MIKSDGENSQLCWLYFNEENKLDFKEVFKQKEATFKGLDKSIEMLVNILKNNQDVTIILGFS